MRVFEPVSADDVGLDAILFSPLCRGWHFSCESDFFSRKLGRTVGHGDVLCAVHGEVYAANAALMRSFHPLSVPPDLGLDALYHWPTGEIWFSVESGFEDQVYGVVRDGDLLSDSGWVIARNAELIRRFNAPATLDCGLDALFVQSFPIGDLDFDGCVSQSDLGVLLSAWQRTDAGDIDFDGDTDQADLGALLAHWLEGCRP